ncbi:MAG: T9SS type A sorting domain-containing protein, partial [Ignavibacteriaceae bacterium]
IGIPAKFELHQNYPNPFNPGTTIKYSIPDDGFVKLAVYNVLGEEVAKLVNEEKPAGNYRVKFSEIDLASGVYIYRLSTGNYVGIMKMILYK